MGEGENPVRAGRRSGDALPRWLGRARPEGRTRGREPEGPQHPGPAYRTARTAAFPRRGARVYRRIAGRDSGLEAFSRNPADGSLAPPAYRPSARTKCPNPLFLSY